MRQNDISLQNENEDKSHVFLAFVLLDTPQWNKKKYISDLKKDWGLDVYEDRTDEEANAEILICEADDSMLTAMFVAAPVPNGEAEYYAEANYLWKDAAEKVKDHKAQIIISVLGSDAKKNGLLLVKAVSSCLRQKNACAVYSDGAVFEPKYYSICADMVRDNVYPVPALVWFGIYRDEEKEGFYTVGLEKFSKDEIEVYLPLGKKNMSDIHAFIGDIAFYIVENDITLHEGETIGSSEDHKCPITRSRGIAVNNDGNTLKIEFI